MRLRAERTPSADKPTRLLTLLHESLSKAAIWVSEKLPSTSSSGDADLVSRVEFFFASFALLGTRVGFFVVLCTADVGFKAPTEHKATHHSHMVFERVLEGRMNYAFMRLWKVLYRLGYKKCIDRCMEEICCKERHFKGVINWRNSQI